MANIQSKKKNIRKIAKQSDRNRFVRSTLKTLKKSLDTLVAKEGDNSEEVKAAAQKYVSSLDKAAKTGVIHQNKANRNKKLASKHVFA